MHATTERVANLLGAAATAVTDDLRDRSVAAFRLNTSNAAALIILRTAPGVSVTELGRRVGLTQSAAVRMVDSLERSGLVERRRLVGNLIGVHPTEEGRRCAEHLLDTRGAGLRRVLDGFDEAQLETLGVLLEKLLEGLYQGPGHADRLCRLCDRNACTAENATCPVGAAERAHLASADEGRSPS
ncbi:MarR family transcriptional regulator [Actinomadura sp. 7K534]|uniref:MarR family winged helix-turn-helix transcriptional regulator n=1 Tax=Actinomadura sp. 7K534 TaxID=2530366 RepID=UPI00104B9D37|nr:MarR family transcriptional regulator [Actinomadura sp. 7K534]TDB96677.1 MarR family transcriptional regulator [Actinomadura sp. 7K534]